MVATPSSAAPKPGDKISCYGHSFTWTPLHQSAEELNKKVFTYDVVATNAIARLQGLLPPKGDPHSRDYFKLLQTHAQTDKTVGRLWDQVNTVPEWVDWEQIDRGQKVYWRYIGPTVVALGQLSLLGSFGYGRAVRVLDRTGGWKTENIMRRLLETAQHTFDVNRDLKALQPGGDGWESSVRVRLLHSSVRRRIMALSDERKDYYDREVDGIPINDMDSIITMNDFASLVVYLGLPRQGIFPTNQEVKDYLAVWRYICYIMGTPHDFLSSPELAKATMESILASEVKPDKAAGTISNNMINGMVGQAPGYASRGFLVASAYWMNGKELATALQIEKPSLYYTTLVAGQCWLFMLISYTRRILPIPDDILNAPLKREIYEVLVHNKKRGGLGYKAKFTFKWIPTLDFRTPAADTEAERKKSAGKFGGTETLALFTILMTVVSTAGGAWGALNLAQRYGLLT